MFCIQYSLHNAHTIVLSFSVLYSRIPIQCFQSTYKVHVQSKFNSLHLKGFLPIKHLRPLCQM